MVSPQEAERSEMKEKLDKEKIRKLLEEADRKWMKNHSGSWHYSDHLDFQTDYLVKKYNIRREKKQK